MRYSVVYERYSVVYVRYSVVYVRCSVVYVSQIAVEVIEAEAVSGKRLISGLLPALCTLFGVVALSVNAKYTFVLLITAVIYPLKHLNVD